MSFIEGMAFVGTTCSAAFYLPQILLVIRKHCLCSLSRTTWTAWLFFVGLSFPYTISTRDPLFIYSRSADLIAMSIIVGFSLWHGKRRCKRHRLYHSRSLQ